MSSAKSPRTLATTTVVESCGACHWWRGHESNPGFGMCKRFPPTPAIGAAALRPTTAAEDWCGEFAQAVVEAARPVGFVRAAEKAA